MQSAQQPAYPAMRLSSFVGQRPIAIIRPAAGVVVTSVGVAHKEEEHQAKLPTLGHLHHYAVNCVQDGAGVQRMVIGLD